MAHRRAPVPPVNTEWNPAGLTDLPTDREDALCSEAGAEIIEALAAGEITAAEADRLIDLAYEVDG